MLRRAYQTRAFEPYAPERDRILAALVDHAGPDRGPSYDEATYSLALASKLDGCLMHPMVYESEDGEIHVSEDRCKSRLCPRCALIRSRALTAKIWAALQRMNSPRMLTLTLRSASLPLRDEIDRLTTCFKNLRRSKGWKSHVDGGAYTIEATWNPTTEQWHPHLHAIIDGRYWPQSAIADAWQAVTGDSRIVDIRMVYDAAKAATYVASYVAKSSDVRQLPDDLIPEWAHSIHGLRMMQTFGSLHGRRLTDDDDDAPPTRQLLGGAEHAARLADAGDPDARLVISALLHERSRLPRPVPPPETSDHAARVAAAARRLWSRQPEPQTEADREAPRPAPTLPWNPREPDRPVGGWKI